MNRRLSARQTITHNRVVVITRGKKEEGRAQGGDFSIIAPSAVSTRLFSLNNLLIPYATSVSKCSKSLVILLQMSPSSHLILHILNSSESIIILQSYCVNTQIAGTEEQ